MIALTLTFSSCKKEAKIYDHEQYERFSEEGNVDLKDEGVAQKRTFIKPPDALTLCKIDGGNWYYNRVQAVLTKSGDRREIINLTFANEYSRETVNITYNYATLQLESLVFRWPSGSYLHTYSNHGAVLENDNAWASGKIKIEESSSSLEGNAEGLLRVNANNSHLSPAQQKALIEDLEFKDIVFRDTRN